MVAREKPTIPYVFVRQFGGAKFIYDARFKQVNIGSHNILTKARAIPLLPCFKSYERKIMAVSGIAVDRTIGRFIDHSINGAEVAGNICSNSIDLMSTTCSVILAGETMAEQSVSNSRNDSCYAEV